MLRLAVPEDLCSSPELPFDLILLRTGQSGHLVDVPFGRNAVRASTASPSFVQRSSRESSASSLTCSRKRSCGFVRFDVGAGDGTALVRKCQKLSLRFHTVCTVFPLYFQSTFSSPLLRWDCRTERPNVLLKNVAHGIPYRDRISFNVRR